MLFSETETNKKLAQRIFLNSLDECVHFPKYFEIETVNACNARCVMCTVNAWDKKKNQVMSKDLFEKFVLEAAGYKDWIETVCLSRDGEPTLDRHLSQRVKMLKDVGIRKVTFSTNGQLLVANLVRDLIEAELDDIMVSIDGLTKSTFEEIRRGLDFASVVENTKKLIHLRDKMQSAMTIRIRMVANPLNLNEADAWMDYWNQLTGEQDRVYIMPMHTWGNQIDLSAPASLPSIITPCVSPFSTMIIHADGSVGLCGVDYSNKHLLGDFTRQSVKDIWQGEGFSRVRQLHATGNREEIDLCVGCDLWDREYKEL